MELKHIVSISKEVEKKLNEFLHEHIRLQLDLYNYSFFADKLGFNGLSHALQVQAQDEVLHQRKLMNYFFQREINYSVNSVTINSNNVKLQSAEEIIIWWHAKKGQFLKTTHEIVQLAKDKNDYATVHFLDWFLEDFCEEIDELKVWHDQFLIANGDYYKWDRHLAKIEEPSTLKVIVPFYNPAHQD